MVDKGNTLYCGYPAGAEVPSHHSPILMYRNQRVLTWLDLANSLHCFQKRPVSRQLPIQVQFHVERYHRRSRRMVIRQGVRSQRQRVSVFTSGNEAPEPQR